MTKREAFLAEVGKALFVAITATAGAVWTARGVLADYDRRLTVIENQQPAVNVQLGEIRSDVREIRAVLLSGGGRQ